MRHIPNSTTTVVESKVKFKGSEEKLLTHADLISLALDIVPQGGFTPKDIRDRNRIQDAVDKAKDYIDLEDSDYENLKRLMVESRWVVRDRDLQNFLTGFEDGSYIKAETTKNS